MKLLPKALANSLPKLGSTEQERDPIVRVKFFTPWSDWTWFATEFDGEDTFFGLVRGYEEELGYFSLKELEDARGPGGLRIERDDYFEPARLSTLRKRAA